MIAMKIRTVPDTEKAARASVLTFDLYISSLYVTDPMTTSSELRWEIKEEVCMGFLKPQQREEFLSKVR